MTGRRSRGAGRWLGAVAAAVARLPAWALIGAVHAYRYTVGLVLPASCKYHPSCSEYAIAALRRYGLVRGSVLAGWRLLRCNPWSHGGVDRVEQQTLFGGSRSRARQA